MVQKVQERQQAQGAGAQQGELRGNPQPQTDFIWPIYADATLAGLSVLFPIPLIDWMLEERFRRRIPGAIARYHNQTLSPSVEQTLNASRGCLSMGALLVLQIPVEIVKRLSRKILYVLTIKEASDKLGSYWQRAFLLNYMLQAGHLETAESARQARRAMDQTIHEAPSPFTSLAKNIVRNRGYVFDLVRHARDDTRRQGVPQPQQWIQQQWTRYETFLQSLAVQYRDIYRERMAQETPSAAA